MQQLNLPGFPSQRLLSESVLDDLRSLRRRVLSLEVELVEARLALGRLVYVAYEVEDEERDGALAGFGGRNGE